MIAKTVSKQCCLVSALVIICLLVVKAAAYEPDYYKDQSNGDGIVMDVAANDNRSDTSTLRVIEPAANGTALPIPYGSGRAIAYIAHSGFFGFDTFRYDYPPFSPMTRVWILVIPNDNATDAGEGCTGKVSNSVGQPVNVTNGNMWLKQQDYLLPGFGAPIEITRFYNSITQANGLFGSGWTSQYDDALTIFSDGKMLRLRSADGRAAYFGRLSTTEPFTSFSPHVTGSIVVQPDLSYTLTYKDGRKRNFSQTGRLTWQRDRNGNQTTLNYDINGVLTGITDAAGRVLSISSNANGNVTQISDATSIVATYEYYPSTNWLKTVTYNDGSKYQFEYDTTTAPGKVLLTTVKDALNNILETHVYDSQGRATTSERHGGVEKYTLLYNQTDPTYGVFTRVTDANGDITKYFFTRQSATNLITRIDGACACGGGSQVTTYEYDTNLSWLNLTKTTDALGRQTTYLYDNNRNVTQITDVLGTQTFTYNSFGDVLKYRDRVDSQNPDPNVTTVTNTYDANGNLLTSKDALNNTTTLTYTSLGQPATIKDARNNTTTLTWDTQGRMTKIKDANNKETNFGYDGRARVTSVTNALAQTTNVEYDLNNRLKKIIYPDTNFVTYTYDLAGRRTAVTDPLNHATTYGYDPAYRLTSVTDALNHSTTYGYDLMSNLTAVTDALGNTTNYEYDAFDRLKKVKYPLPSAGGTRLEENFTYDLVSNLKTRVDTANRTTTYDYDNANRLIKITDALTQLTHFEYNARSQMTKVRDALNQEYVFTYDALGRQLTQTRAGSTMSFEYDAVGNRKKRTDYVGRVTHYTYDNLNRLTQIAYGINPGESGTSKQYSYDALSRLISAVNEAGTVSFTYDNRGRLKTETDVFGHVTERVYDAASRRTELKLDGASYATYTYDIADRLTGITNISDSTTIGLGYDNANRITSRTYPNGVNTTYEYDGMSRLTRLKDVNSSATLFDRQYSYDTANQISQIVEPSLSRVFGYDNIDRLTSVTGGMTENYIFDGVGNRTSSHRSSTYTYQPFNNLTSTQTTSYTYDLNGNLASKSEGSNFWRYTWDYENRMARAATRKQTATYRFDALGRRVRRYVGSENTKFIYDGQDVLADDNAGVLTKYQNGFGIDNKLRAQTGSDTKYFLADHLGSTNGLADSTGALAASNSYDSFGNPSNTSFPSRYQFTGREYDNFSGLNYYRARLYDANLGRFISEDPIGFAGGDVNLYGYVRNQPQWYRDPMGLQPGADVMRHPAFWQSVAAAGGALGAGVGAAASSPVAVGAGGLALGVGIGYYPGQWTANSPYNPFVHGPWPLNPFKPPFGYPAPVYPTPITASPTSQPYCETGPKATPLFNWPPITYPIPLGPYPPQTPEKDEECYQKCQHLLGIGDYGVQFITCVRRCAGRID